MSVFRVSWNDGSGDMLSFNSEAGSGDYSLEVSSVLNEGADRSRPVYVSVGSVTKQITVNQTGMREVFLASDGEFTTFDGNVFNVLK